MAQTVDPLAQLMAGVNPTTGQPTPQNTQSPSLAQLFAGGPAPAQAAPDPGPQPRQGIGTEFVRGLGSGVEQIQSDVQSLGAVGATAFGFDETATEWAQLARKTQEEALRDYPRTIESVEEIQSPTDFAYWAARTLGEQVPVIGSILLGGGAGGLLGRAVGRGALSLPQGSAALARLGSIGAGTGAVTTATGIETGATGSEMYEATGKIDAGLAFGAGIAKGALEAIVPAALGARFGLTPDLSRGLVGKLIGTFDRVIPNRLAAATATGFSESLTEGLQETIDLGVRSFVDENYDALGPEGASRLLNSVAAGGFVGFLFGGLAGGGTPMGRQVPIQTGDVGPDEIDPGSAPTPFVPQSLPGGLGGTAISTGTVSPGVFAGQFTPDVQGPGEIRPRGFPDRVATEEVPTPQPEQAGLVVPRTPVDTVPHENLPGVQVTEGWSHNVGILTEESNGVGLVFRPPDEAQAEDALGPDGTPRQTVKVNVDALAPEDVTVALAELPSEGVTVGSEGAQFIRPDTRDQALELVNEAIQMRREAVIDALGGGLEPLVPGRSAKLTAAEQRYREAVELGFRWEPRDGQAFMLTRPLKPGELQPTENIARQPNVSGDALQDPRARETRDDNADPDLVYTSMPEDGNLADGRTFAVPLGPRQRFGIDESLNRSTSFPQSRAFKLDRTKLPKEHLSHFDPTSFKYSQVGERLKAGEFDLNPEAFARAIQESDNYSLAADADPAAVWRHLKDFTLMEAGVAQEIRDSARDAYSRAIQAGLRETVKEGDKSVIYAGPVGALRQAIVSEVPIAADVMRGPTAAPSENYQPANVAELRSANGRTIDGKLYDPAKHKPGTVVVLRSAGYARLTGKQQRAAKRAAQLYQNWMRKFGYKDYKLVLFFDTLGGRFNLKERSDGTFWALGPQAGVIGLAARNANSLRDFYATAAHEFGHLIHLTKLLDQNKEVIDRLVSAYNRDLIRSSMGGTVGRFKSDFLSPGGVGRVSSTAFTSDLMSDQSYINSQYWFSFNEWFAEQTVKWVTDFDLPTLDPLGRMFKAIARQIRILFRDIIHLYKKEGLGFEVNPTFKQWMDIMYQSADTMTLVNDTPHLQQGLDQLNEEAREANAKLLSMGMDPQAQHSVRAPNASALGGRVQGLFNKLGLKGQIFDEVSADLDYFNNIAKYGFNVYQLADKNKHITRLQRYKELIDQWWVYKMGFISRADQRVREWRQLSKTQTDLLSQFIFDLDNMVYLKPDEKPRWPTDVEFQALARKYKLEPGTLELYQRIKEDFTHILNEIEQTAIIDIKRTFKEKMVQDFNIFDVKKEFDALRARPYFPHSRFGDFAIVVKDKDGKTVFMQQFETKKAAHRALPEVLKKYPKGTHGIRLDTIPKSVQPFRGLPPSLLKSIRTKLQLTDEQKVWLDQMLVEYMPSQSFRKRLTKRENVPGYSMDAMRGYANYFFHGANYFARIRYFDVLQDEINGMGQDISALGATGLVDVTKRRRIQEFVQDHFNYTMNPGKDWAQLRSLAFQWWLGFSPVSAAVNFTQIPMVAWPYLGSRFGDIKAANELRKATTDLQKIYRNKEGTIPDDEFNAIRRGIEQGFLDESQATELAGVSEGDNLQRLLPGTQAQRLLMQTAHWSAFLFQTSEKINRRVTFRAAYRLAKNNPDAKYLTELVNTEHLEFQSLRAAGYNEVEAKAFLAGKDAVRRTQFEYAQHARPKFMQGRRGTILTFFMFVQNMVYFASHSPGRTKYLLMLLLAAGLMGLPGAEDLASIAKFAARNLFGKDFDIERELREFVVELTNSPSAADLILHGTSRVGFGMPDAMDKIGIPVPRFDLSASISMGQLVPGVAELGKPGLDFEQRFSNVSTDVAGAAFGIGINLLKFASDDSLPIDDVKRWERAVPRALRNVLRASRYAEEGRERTRTGATLVEFDASDPQQLAEIIGQGLGFTPTRVTQKWDRITMQREAAAFWQVRKGMLLAQYDHAYTVGDREAESDVRRAVRRYNDEVPFVQMRITSKTLTDSRKERIRRRRLAEAGLPQNKKEIPLYRHIQRITPDADSSVSVEDVTRLR